MLLANLSELKAALEIDPADSSEDLRLNFFLKSASAWIETFLGRPGMEKKSRTEYYNGTGTQALSLRHYPVDGSVTPQVWEDRQGLWGNAPDAFAATTALTHGTDFSLAIDSDDGTSRSGLLIRNNAAWPRPDLRQRGFLSPWVGDARGNVKVTYTGGYTADTLPADIVMACVSLVGRMRHVFPLGVPLSSESYEDRSISVLIGDKNYLMGQVKHMLMPYRNFRF